MRTAASRRRSCHRLLVALLARAVRAAASAAIVWNKVYAGFSSPVEITHAHDGSQRLFVVQQAGTIRIVKNGVGAGDAVPRHRRRDRCDRASGEQGLLGLAFHPQYATNRQFYVNYTRTVRRRHGDRPLRGERRQPRRRRSGVRHDPAHHRAAGGQPQRRRPRVRSRRLSVHRHGRRRRRQRPRRNRQRQDTTTLLGKILRIDVDNGGAHPTRFRRAIRMRPASAGRSEIFAIGVRNPWRMSFDRVTGDFWIGDVGQGAVEEIDMLAAGTGAGANFGWRIMEGNAVHGPGAARSRATTPSLTPPIITYTHALGCSVTGGYRLSRRRGAGARSGSTSTATFAPAASGPRNATARGRGRPTRAWRDRDTRSARSARTRRASSTSPTMRPATSTVRGPPIRRCTRPAYRRRRDRVLPRGPRSLLHDVAFRGNRGAGCRPVQLAGRGRSESFKAWSTLARRDEPGVPVLHATRRRAIRISFRPVRRNAAMCRSGSRPSSWSRRR